MRTLLLRVSAILAAAGLVLTGCATNNNILRNVEPGTVVYIDGVNEAGDEGDQALVERKPGGWWVVPLDATYTLTEDPQHTVRVRVTPAPDVQFIVEAVGPIQVGEDHDNCLANGEVPVLMRVPEPGSLQFEPVVPEQPSSEQDTDCLATPDAA